MTAPVSGGRPARPRPRADRRHPRPSPRLPRARPDRRWRRAARPHPGRRGEDPPRPPHRAHRAGRGRFPRRTRRASRDHRADRWRREAPRRRGLHSAGPHRPAPDHSRVPTDRLLTPRLGSPPGPCGGVARRGSDLGPIRSGGRRRKRNRPLSVPIRELAEDVGARAGGRGQLGLRRIGHEAGQRDGVEQRHGADRLAAASRPPERPASTRVSLSGHAVEVLRPAPVKAGRDGWWALMALADPIGLPRGLVSPVSRPRSQPARLGPIHEHVATRA